MKKDLRLHLPAMRAKTVAFALIASFNFSVCTGGILSAGTALAASVGSDASTAVLPMTPADSGFLCQSATPNIPSHPGISRSDAASNCQDGHACLAQAHANTTDRALQLLAPLLVIVAIAMQTLPLSVTQWIPTGLARRGPLYEPAPVLAHVLVKRE